MLSVRRNCRTATRNANTVRHSGMLSSIHAASFAWAFCWRCIWHLCHGMPGSAATSASRLISTLNPQRATRQQSQIINRPIVNSTHYHLPTTNSQSGRDSASPLERATPRRRRHSCFATFPCLPCIPWLISTHNAQLKQSQIQRRYLRNAR